ncbi:MAG: hypothetical protein ABR929_13215, partial [Roseiarcus sp.]
CTPRLPTPAQPKHQIPISPALHTAGSFLGDFPTPDGVRNSSRKRSGSLRACTRRSRHQRVRRELAGVEGRGQPDEASKSNDEHARLGLGQTPAPIGLISRKKRFGKLLYQLLPDRRIFTERKSEA